MDSVYLTPLTHKCYKAEKYYQVVKVVFKYERVLLMDSDLLNLKLTSLRIRPGPQ